MIVVWYVMSVMNAQPHNKQEYIYLENMTGPSVYVCVCVCVCVCVHYLFQ